MKRLESIRFSEDIADKIVLIKYQKLPSVLNLMKSWTFI